MLVELLIRFVAGVLAMLLIGIMVANGMIIAVGIYVVWVERSPLLAIGISLMLIGGLMWLLHD